MYLASPYHPRTIPVRLPYYSRTIAVLFPYNYCTIAVQLPVASYHIRMLSC